MPHCNIFVTVRRWHRHLRTTRRRRVLHQSAALLHHTPQGYSSLCAPRILHPKFGLRNSYFHRLPYCATHRATRFTGSFTFCDRYEWLRLRLRLRLHRLAIDMPPVSTGSRFGGYCRIFPPPYHAPQVRSSPCATRILHSATKPFISSLKFRLLIACLTFTFNIQYSTFPVFSVVLAVATPNKSKIKTPTSPSSLLKRDILRSARLWFR